MGLVVCYCCDVTVVGLF